MRLYFILFAILLSSACGDTTALPNVNSMTSNRTNGNTTIANSVKTSGGVPVYSYEVVNTFKHDSKAFTQGLFFHNGFL